MFGFFGSLSGYVVGLGFFVVVVGFKKNNSFLSFSGVLLVCIFIIYAEISTNFAICMKCSRYC